MSNKAKIMMFVMIMVVSLSVAAIAFILMPACEYCASRLCFGTCTDSPSYKFDPEKDDSVKAERGKTNQKQTRISATERADDDYLKNLVFIGDSRTVALQAFAELDEDKVFAEEGLNHEDALWKEVVLVEKYTRISIPDAVKLTAPDVMVINFGINGIAWMSTETFIEGYEKLIDEIIKSSETSIIVIESIMPVSKSYENREDGVSNEKIDEANDALYRMAERKGLYYLDTSEVLKDENNDLMSSYSGDGLHYNKAAYDVIVDYIMHHAIYKTKNS